MLLIAMPLKGSEGKTRAGGKAPTMFLGPRLFNLGKGMPKRALSFFLENGKGPDPQYPTNLKAA